MKFNKEKYLEHNGLICPYCDSKEITATSSDFDDDYCWRNVACDDCGETWQDIYTLTDVNEG